jgi:hypothetical protein
MPAWGWVLIVVGVIVVLALVAWQAVRARRTRDLRGRFGPEYDRTVEGADSRRAAEADLAARAERRDTLDIRPLDSATRSHFVGEWQRVQARFVDDPPGAVAEADVLIQSVMRERGYPVDDFDQRAADVSVDHPDVVENYREGHRLAKAGAIGDGTTEDLRQAMRHYRALFQDLVEDSADAPLDRDRSTADAEAHVGER